ncbi:MAG: Ribonuclease H [Candidatus Roizmanbacteria bacterium GW2011_GWA2_36_23]|uniref:Ribonuclease H n=1 Tax=Candidatus Roizmanbacteria bacterium GW2011_GWA2_36_23 TaxID=1618480 RepID=A0A0G0E7P5_9BACT|nr:MAG: Ribonuclease H [Candidatus Roizmanbacteria bacterium GW2011_GWA2_36_23]
MVIKIYTDGGSLNNPGQAAFAYLIYKNDSLLFSFSKPIGIATNNIAEYTGLIRALEKIKDIQMQNKLAGLKKIVVRADSLLMISQLNGVYKVKNTNIRECVLKIRILENEINVPIEYSHVYRKNNQMADSLVKKALGR